MDADHPLSGVLLPRRSTAIAQAEGKAAESRVGFECNADLLEESVEGGVASRGIALLDVDLDLDCMLVVRAPEAAERGAPARPDHRRAG